MLPTFLGAVDLVLVPGLERPVLDRRCCEVLEASHEPPQQRSSKTSETEIRAEREVTVWQEGLSVLGGGAPLSHRQVEVIRVGVVEREHRDARDWIEFEVDRV